MNIKVSNLISRTNETRQIEWHETCKCIKKIEGKLGEYKEGFMKIEFDSDYNLPLTKTL